MKETIAEMLKVEAQARDIVAEAGKQAEEIVRNARTEAAAIQDAAQRDAQAASAETIKQGVEQARKRRNQILAEIDTKTERLRHVEQKKTEEVQKLILAALTARQQAQT